MVYIGRSPCRAAVTQTLCWNMVGTISLTMVVLLMRLLLGFQLAAEAVAVESRGEKSVAFDGGRGFRETEVRTNSESPVFSSSSSAIWAGTSSRSPSQSEAERLFDDEVLHEQGVNSDVAYHMKKQKEERDVFDPFVSRILRLLQRAVLPSALLAFGFCVVAFFLRVLHVQPLVLSLTKSGVENVEGHPVKKASLKGNSGVTETVEDEPEEDVLKKDVLVQRSRVIQAQTKINNEQVDIVPLQKSPSVEEDTQVNNASDVPVCESSGLQTKTGIVPTRCNSTGDVCQATWEEVEGDTFEVVTVSVTTGNGARTPQRRWGVEAGDGTVGSCSSAGHEVPTITACNSPHPEGSKKDNFIEPYSKESSCYRSSCTQIELAKTRAPSASQSRETAVIGTTRSHNKMQWWKGDNHCYSFSTWDGGCGSSGTISSSECHSVQTIPSPLLGSASPLFIETHDVDVGSLAATGTRKAPCSAVETINGGHAYHAVLTTASLDRMDRHLLERLPPNQAPSAISGALQTRWNEELPQQTTLSTPIVQRLSPSVDRLLSSAVQHSILVKAEGNNPAEKVQQILRRFVKDVDQIQGLEKSSFTLLGLFEQLIVLLLEKNHVVEACAAVSLALASSKTLDLSVWPPASWVLFSLILHQKPPSGRVLPRSAVEQSTEAWREYESAEETTLLKGLVEIVTSPLQQEHTEDAERNRKGQDPAAEKRRSTVYHEPRHFKNAVSRFCYILSLRLAEAVSTEKGDETVFCTESHRNTNQLQNFLSLSLSFWTQLIGLIADNQLLNPTEDIPVLINDVTQVLALLPRRNFAHKEQLTDEDQVEQKVYTELVRKLETLLHRQPWGSSIQNTRHYETQYSLAKALAALQEELRQKFLCCKALPRDLKEPLLLNEHARKGDDSDVRATTILPDVVLPGAQHLTNGIEKNSCNSDTTVRFQMHPESDGEGDNILSWRKPQQPQQQLQQQQQTHSDHVHHPLQHQLFQTQKLKQEKADGFWNFRGSFSGGFGGSLRWGLHNNFPSRMQQQKTGSVVLPLPSSTSPAPVATTATVGGSGVGSSGRSSSSSLSSMISSPALSSFSSPARPLPPSPLLESTFLRDSTVVTSGPEEKAPGCTNTQAIVSNTLDHTKNHTTSLTENSKKVEACETGSPSLSTVPSPSLIENNDACAIMIQSGLYKEDWKTASMMFEMLYAKKSAFLSGVTEEQSAEDIQAAVSSAETTRWEIDALHSLLGAFTYHEDLTGAENVFQLLKALKAVAVPDIEILVKAYCRGGNYARALEALKYGMEQSIKKEANTQKKLRSIEETDEQEDANGQTASITTISHSDNNNLLGAIKIYLQALLDGREFPGVLQFIDMYVETPSEDPDKEDSHAVPQTLALQVLGKMLKMQPDRQVLRRVMEMTTLAKEDAGLKKERSAKVIVDSSLFAALIDCCIRLSDNEHLYQLIDRLRSMLNDEDIVLDLQTCGVLIKALGAQGRIDDCRWVFWRLTERQHVEPSEVTYGCMLDALVNNNCVTEAVALFEEMKAVGRIRPNTIMYSTIVKGYAQDKQLDNAIRIHEEMKEAKIVINTVTYNTLVDACARVGAMDKAAALLEDMLTSGVEPDLITFSTIAKGYCVQGDVSRAMQLLAAMKERGICPDGILYNSLLDGCVRALRPDLCEELWNQMQSAGIPPSNFTLTIFIKMFGRAGKLNQAFEAVRQLPKRYGFNINAHVYTCLMSACIANREFGRAFEVFHCMQTDGVTPDAKTYETVLFGAMRSRRLMDGIQIVREAFALDKPRLAHLNTMPMGFQSRRGGGCQRYRRGGGGVQGIPGLQMDPKNILNLWGALRDAGQFAIAERTIDDMQQRYGAAQIQKYLPRNYGASEGMFRGERQSPAPQERSGGCGNSRKYRMNDNGGLFRQRGRPNGSKEDSSSPREMLWNRDCNRDPVTIPKANVASSSFTQYQRKPNNSPGLSLF